MCIAEWDEKLAREWISRTPKSVASDPERSQRAELEFQKKNKAYIAVRPPQEQLDPRILELVSNPSVPVDDRPTLYYGLIIHRSDREAYIHRIGLNILNNAEELKASGQYELVAETTVETSLSVKCMLPLEIIRPFGFERDVYVVALDDTEQMRQNKKEVLGGWDATVSRVLKTLRRELGLADQGLKWYWDSECDTWYKCPLPEYNPPQVRYEIQSDSGSDSDDDAVYSGLDLNPSESDSDLDSDSDSDSDVEDQIMQTLESMLTGSSS